MIRRGWQVEPIRVTGAIFLQFLAQPLAGLGDARIVALFERGPKLVDHIAGGAIDVQLVDVIAPHFGGGLALFANGEEPHGRHYTRLYSVAQARKSAAHPGRNHGIRST